MKQFKQIPSFPKYEISKDGIVRNIRTGNIVKFVLDRYYKQSLRVGDKSVICYLHRAMYETYIGKLNKSLQIDHIDGNRLNNTVSNLQQISREDNVQKSRVRQHLPKGLWFRKGGKDVKQKYIRAVNGRQVWAEYTLKDALNRYNKETL